ncbi:hypothetical protein L211DRAFT_841166 [Terfezia boudieri ATCC MYA-4762]|uniref:H-type lectin domain-containing protein n=1 Tax=Terfezia boudieri ATCC MYA-4762 TaxID=1051890 RepID=A0A3N4LDP8_9PEZI|nr:hypothetical protein L211DRAFT_841166 [Terfezia boudieri ATCC MYA-4762]
MSTGQELSLSLKIDSGSWNTNQVRDWRYPVAETEGRVNFSKKFTSLPTVIVSMSSVDVSNQSNFRVNVYATHVNLEGFTVHVNSWADTKIYSCGVSWLAIGH